MRPSLTDENLAKSVLGKIHLRPKCDSGQNFLIDEKILDKIISYSNISKEDSILEIGPGLGSLTERLARRSKKLFAVEMDKKLFSFLQKRFAESKNVILKNADIMKIENSTIKEALGGDYRMISNIPYQITGKIFKKFVSEGSDKPKDAILLAQKEVGERICAQEGSLSLLAISVQIYCEPKIVSQVGPDCFWPRPKVSSVLLALQNIKEKPKIKIDDIKKFWKILRICFSSPRKQIHNNLSSGLHISPKESKELLEKAGINPASRSQEVGAEKWPKLCEFVDFG